MKNLDEIKKTQNQTQVIDSKALAAIKGGGGRSEPPPFGVEY